MASVEIRESEIEDIFAQYPLQLRNILDLSDEVFLVARQKLLPSGRLDLVYSHLADLLLIELKVEPFRKAFVNQVLGYRNDLIGLQKSGEFVTGNVRAILLCPHVTRSDKQFANGEGVDAFLYDPGEVLIEFYRKAPLDVKYLSVEPKDLGVWRIGLMSEALYASESYQTIQQVARHRGQSPKTVGNQLRLAADLGLFLKKRNEFHLSSIGKEFVSAKDDMNPPGMISRTQAAIIRRFMLSNPFFSGVTFGIITLVSSIFELSKNTYPVPLALLAQHFINSAGLTYRWDSETAVRKGVRMYTNYATDLGLVGKVGNNYFVTPSGLNFVLLLNMRKSLKMIESASTIE